MLNRTIVVDIDGVFRDSVRTMVKVYNQNFGTKMTLDDVKYYDVADSFPLIKEKLGIEPTEFFFGRHYGEQINRYSDTCNGALDAIELLHEKGWYVHFVSYQPSYKNKLHTLMWLDDTRVKYDGLTFVNIKDKASFTKCYTIVDDNPKFLEGHCCDYVVLVDQPYNKDAVIYDEVRKCDILNDYEEQRVYRVGSLYEFAQRIQRYDELNGNRVIR